MEAVQNQALERAIRWAGSEIALAAKLEIDPNNVRLWVRNGQVPPGRAIQIETLTNGRIRAWQLVGNLPPKPAGRPKRRRAGDR